MQGAGTVSRREWLEKGMQHLRLYGKPTPQQECKYGIE